ncbi:ATP-grasp domain-containing protein [Citrobacter gillenii]|jgi:carbamoylphosphate synthase large subunit|uniref:ATP-grasp domain-containing protein n=1 Tax=Citrobacter gillenii TaxID=67828 RepID=A0ABD6LYB3_9ENTR|nr:ATP-grasp domain-containing protein [Citrobacter gillenii]NTZ49472.1 ATP-grasp domain-containing protein [Citrobacter gillenii]
MTNILIFPAGTEIGKEIYYVLRHDKHINITLAGSDYDSHARHCACAYHVIPDIAQPNWLDALQQLLQLEKIDYIFPAHDDALLALSEKRDALSATVLCPPHETCQTTRYKSKTYQSLRKILPVPAVYTDSNKITQWPVFVKPDRGQGAQGASCIETPEALASLLAQQSDLIVCEYLSGDEYTVDCFSDRDRGLLFCQPRTRSRIRAGIAMTSRLVTLEHVEEYARAISDRFHMRGAWFFQLKRAATGELTLLEVAPRIAGTMALNRVNGINFPLLTVYEAMRKKIALLPVCKELQITRSLSNQYKHSIQFQHVYIDYDDTVIINDKLCLLVITFLYQCINHEISIHLITRHAGDIHLELNTRRISMLFDSIIHLDKDAKKSDWIKQQNSIFIDDSFSERMEVFNAKEIPTFDINMLELLIRD